MVLRDISSVVINSDTSRHAAAQRIMFSLWPRANTNQSSSCRQACQQLSCAMYFFLELAWPCTYTHAYLLASRTTQLTLTHRRSMVCVSRERERAIGVGDLWKGALVLVATGCYVLYILILLIPHTTI
ncbi:hypothetical protein CFAM422_000752 [Trichoderma lentiforme]|uniref:Uncharacterized protein n=1 Tax=Trichoderma lentiforme TaxID=1567552 RepID=A0A9P5CGU4_9HYPO|nr:hypothetical protein CFAM422_000752 [Trichoderma lentiforme]